jgi:predicted metallo-beta-lactamase superfamily hydrolase
MRKVSPASSTTELGFKVTPLAAESLGVRSMCTYVETPDLKILIDPGVSLGPRFGLLPHPIEYEALRQARKRLADHANESSIVTISHYHHDHATPTYTDYLWNFSDLAVATQLYQDKIVLAKDHRNMINPSQRRRGWMLKERIEKVVKSFEPADGQTFTYGNTTLTFSQPVFHGEKDTPLGWVLMLSIEYGGNVFVHASDIQGPMLSETADILFSYEPKLVYLGGPPTYLADYRLRKSVISKAFDNLCRITEKVNTIVVDHHLLREGGKPQGFEKVLAASEKAGHIISTAAEFLGIENSFLEAKRNELYKEYPPSQEFLRWTKLTEETRMRSPPP